MIASPSHNRFCYSVLVANISDIKPEFTFDAVHIKQVTALFRDKIIDQNYVRSLFYQSTSQVGANKAHAAGDKSPGPTKWHCPLVHALNQSIPWLRTECSSSLAVISVHTDPDVRVRNS